MNLFSVLNYATRAAVLNWVFGISSMTFATCQRPSPAPLLSPFLRLFQANSFASIQNYPVFLARMVVPKLAKNGFYSSFWVWGQFQVSSVSMPSVARISFPKYESGINTIFDHFRNRHARKQRCTCFGKIIELKGALHVAIAFMYSLGHHKR